MLIEIIIIVPVFWLVLFLRYRITTGDEVVFKHEMVYQVIDLGQGDIIRMNVLENLVGNKRIFTSDVYGNSHCFYVIKEDFKRCWDRSSESVNETKTKLLTIRTKKLLLGGYAPSVIEKIECLNKRPLVRK